MTQRPNDSVRGFTLIELLVVVAIIGFISGIVLASVGTAREKGRDARRFSDMAQIQKALEMYYSENGQYPAINQATTGSTECGPSDKWCELETALTPHLSRTPRDPRGLQTDYFYLYDSDPGNSHQTYGLAMKIEYPGNNWRANVDGGWYQGEDCCYFELGEEPSFCIRRYGTGATGNWWTDDGTDVCNGGN